MKHINPVADFEGNIMGTVPVFQNISQEKGQDQMNNEYVNLVSHELKAPLAAIQQLLDVIIEGMAGEVTTKQAHLLTRARTRSDELIKLINELLNIGRIESGSIVCQQVALDLAPLITDVVEFVRPQAEAKRQSLLVDIPNELPPILGDPRNIDELFINLINNAIKYTPEGGNIHLKVMVINDFVQICVKDSGIGIHQDDLPRIFEKFYRVRNEKTKNISGTGLGLAIVKGIVDAHHGTIKVRSEINKGTVFEILIPLLNKDRDLH